MNETNESEKLNKKTDLKNENENVNIFIKETTEKNENKKTYSSFKGFLYVSLAAFFGTFQHYFMLKAKFYNGIEQTTIRYLFQLIMMLILAKCYKVSLKGPKNQHKTLIIRGIMGACGLLFLNVSIKLINPSDAVALFFTNIIIVSVLARIIFKEKFTIAHIVALIAMFFGIGLISQPSFLISKLNQNNNINTSDFNFSSNKSTQSSNEISPLTYFLGVLSAIIGACFASCVIITLKKLTNKKVHHTVIILFAAYVGLPISSAIALSLLISGYTIKNSNEYKNFNFMVIQTIYACLSALMGCFMQISMNVSYKYDDASKISIYRTMDLIFTFIMQYFLLDIKSNKYSIIGSILIVLGNLLVLTFKLIDRNLENTTNQTNDKLLNDSQTNQSKFKTFLDFIKRIIFIKF